MKVVEVDVESQYSKWKELKKEDVEEFRRWTEEQPHFPPVKELDLIVFLHSCFYDLDAAKSCMDKFLIFKTQNPELFTGMDPRREELKVAANAFCVGVLPTLTPEGQGIVYARMLDTSVLHFEETTKNLINSMMLHCRELGALDGYIIVIDCEGLGLGHLLKVPMSLLRKGIYMLQECLPVRMKAIHFINPPYIFDKALALIRPFTKSDVIKMMTVHRTTSVFDHIPTNSLPNESGGTYGPISELQDYFAKRLEANYERIVADELEMLSDESKRVKK